METEKANNIELESRKEDLDFLINKLEEIHPDPYRNINQEKEIFEKSLEKSLEVENEYFPLAIQESLCLLKDAHTRVKDFQDEYFPFIFKTMQGKTYIIATNPETKDHLYKEVQAINNYPLQKIFEKISALSSKENTEVLLKDLDSSLDSNKVLRYYGFSDSKKVNFTTNTGSFFVEFERDEKKHIDNPLNWEGKDFEFVGNKTYRFRTQGKILIFQYNACKNTGFSNEYLKKFKDELLEKTEESENLVIDLRLNSGGDTEVMRDLFEKIPKQKNIYVASSRKTFSSAMHHLFYLKRKKNAIIIGENAGQKANRFGYGEDIELPNSKIQVSFSQMYYNLYPEKDLEVVEPDIEIPVTIDDWKNQKDPLNKWIEENLK